MLTQLRKRLVEPCPRPLKQRYPVEKPWEYKMTLCIAANCQHQGEPRIVVCSDWKAGEDFFGSETSDKQRSILPGWLGLVAGVDARANELLGEYRDYMRTNPVKPFEILSVLKEPANIQRTKIMDEICQAYIGRSYDWLLSEGQESLPTDYFQRLLSQVEATKLGAQLLVCGFVKYETVNIPVICVVNDTGDMPYVRVAENFASIGTGSVVADATLHRREHQCNMPLKKALYNVLEAKRLGEIASGVGTETTVSVLLPTGRHLSISPDGQDFLESCFAKYAPKPLDDCEDWEALPPGFLDTGC